MTSPQLRRVCLVLAILVLLPAIAHAAPAVGANCSDASSFDEYRQRGWVWAYLASFGFGFLTSLTPCVYPMIPIVLGIFGARGESVSRGKAMMLATLYVIGMGVTYAVLGVVFAMVGGQFGSLLAKPYVVIPIVLIYLALASSMFGAFELALPTAWQNKLNTIGGAGARGAFMMGLVGGFTAAPCTGPFLVGLLGFVANSGNVALGGTLLFVYAIGMGVLFWALAAFAMALPKSGRWMEWVKSIGGIALLAAAIYFLRPVVPAIEDAASAETWFLIASAAAVVAGIALGAVHLSFHDGTGVKIRKAFAVGLTVVGLSGAIGWLLTPDRHLPWVYRDEATAFAQAKASGKGVMIDFSAKWCVPCKRLELEFAKDDDYNAITSNFVPLKIDVTSGSDEDFDFQDKYQAHELPAIVFVDADGHELGRFASETDPGALMAVVKPAVSRLHGAAPDAPCVASR